MARKNGSDGFIDMFRQFGERMNLPGVDIDRIIEHHRRNLTTLEKTAKAASEGASSVMAKQKEILQETLREVSEMAQDYRPGANPQDMMARQADFARRSFETAVKNASDMAEVVRKSSTETIEILRDRIREAMEEVRESVERKK